MEAFMAAFKQPSRQGIGITAEEKKSKRERLEKNLPWIEKYRPKSIDDVAHQEEVIAVLRKTISTYDFPNLLFYGPPGTGKTSTILAAARELFGPELYADRVLELNASDERGIQVVRTKIKKFAQFVAHGTRADGTPCPSFKIVILDEADSMTPPAQAALRRTMEKESRSTRFCLVCNYISRIIDPITSRCAKFRFKPLDERVAIERVQLIANKEGLQVEETALRTLVSACEGDLRQAITLLQSCAFLAQSPVQGSSEGAVLTPDVVEEVVGRVPQALILRITTAIQENSFSNLQTAVKACLSSAHPASQVVLQFYDWTLTCDLLSEKKKAAILQHISLVDARLTNGADEYLQLMSLFCLAMQVFHEQ